MKLWKGDETLPCRSAASRPARTKKQERLLWYVLLAASLGLGGCARDSLRAAIAAQQRANQVQQAVFDRQHDALCVLLYRDLQRRLEHAGLPLTPEGQAALSEVWNDRDLVEFWTVQHERARALRLAGVDANLYGSQAVVDLLHKWLARKTHLFNRGLASRVAQHTAEQPAERNE